MPNRVRITLECDGPLQAHHMVQLNRLARTLKTEPVIVDYDPEAEAAAKAQAEAEAAAKAQAEKPKRAPKKPKPSSAGQGSMLEGEPDE